MLDLYMFQNLTEIREHTERWLHDHNEEIPHDALDGLTPVGYQQLYNLESSSPAWF